MNVGNGTPKANRLNNVERTVWSGHSCPLPLFLILPSFLICPHLKPGCPISRVFCEQWESPLPLPIARANEKNSALAYP
jgi:hypothetical protein